MKTVVNALRLVSTEVKGIVSLLCALLSPNVALAQDDWRFSDVERVVAVADIHGAYDAFEEILRRTELIDDTQAWTGRNTNLVIVGDVLDRGPDSRRALDLIRQLEPQAEATGGRVHLVLGNHEIMNLTGDLRYVSSDEYAAFADEEPLETRAAEFDLYVEALGRSPDLAEARTMFDTAYPLGFFAHREAFSFDGEYGAWLRTKPVLVVLNDVAYVHGGVVQAMIDESTDLNKKLSQELNDYVAAIETLVTAGRLSPTVEVYDMPLRANQLLRRLGSESLNDAELEAAARHLLELDSLELFAPDGLLWYRGNVGCSRLTEQDRLGPALQTLGARHLVVGHTPTQGAAVLSRMDEMLLRIDTGMLNEFYGGRGAALIIEGGELSVIYENESKPSKPLAQPRRVGLRPASLSAEELEDALLMADLGADQPFDGTTSLLTLVYGDIQLQGVFMPATNEDVRAEVAAYRLDRLLELDMVPVTVAREIAGVAGSVQFWPESAISETQRNAERLGSSAWCPLGDQINSMYLFDALIFNEARTRERIRYSTDNFQLLLVGHDQTFSTDRSRPAYLADIPVELTPTWREALSGLDEATVTSALGDVLDRRRIRALLARRDQLLEIAH